MILRYHIAAFTILTLGNTVASTPFDLFGLRKTIYNPRCAHACREPISTSVLSCTSNSTRISTNECHATDDNLLQTLAYCISRHCKVPLGEIEDYWRQHVAGYEIVDPAPKYSYETAVQLAGEPTRNVSWGGELDSVYVITDEDYEKSYNSLLDWTDNENLHARYALALFLCGFVVPVLLSLLRFIPISSTTASKWRAWFIYPTVWSHRWSMQIREAGDVSPTRGQACFILYMLALNVVFLATGHYGSMYSFWSFDGRHGQLVTCLANRFGALAVANIPLLFLYAGRNNVLLWVTNCSHCTFIMIHRWLGYFVVAEAILHSVLYLNLAVQRHSHTAWSHNPAWYFGIIGTVSISLIAPLSIVYIRRRVYEVFLFLHIAVTVPALVGIYFHIVRLYDTQVHGWIVYLWFYVLFWCSDRVVRIVRVGLNGIKRAHITIIDEEYIRVDIPNAKGAGHAYLYFPTLSWRFWENHPFSVATSSRRGDDSGSYFSRLMSERGNVTIGLDTRVYSSTYLKDLGSPDSDRKSFDSKLSSPTSIKSPISPMSLLPPIPESLPVSPFGHSLLSPQSTSHLLLSPGEKPLDEKMRGLTFFMRTHGGTTAHLRKRTSLPVLVEASYGPPKDLSMYPVLICVAGGVGITAVLPYLHGHHGTTRLYWASRSQGLVNAMRDETRGYNGEILVGRRLFVKLALRTELARFDSGTPIAIVVSGPKAMCEEVREFCCEIAVKRRGEVRFLDENFSW